MLIEIATDATTVSLRERKKQATRDSIHAVALRLVVERGPEKVTVEEVCGEVGISQRTFFNYFPTKLAAAFDLAEKQLTEEVRQRFLNGSSDLISDACDLVAASISVPSDYPRIKELLLQRPELGLTFWQQMNLRKQPVIDVITERVGDREIAATAFGIVMVAIMATMRKQGETGAEAIAARLKGEVRKMAELIGPCGQ